MSIIAKMPERTFVVCPEGLYQAVCIDIVDLGLQTGPYGEKHKVELRWLTDDVEDTQQRHQLRKRYTLSLHEKSNLRKDLECWRGRKFTETELKGFDLEKLLGVNCQLQIIHNISDEGRTYDNVQAIVPVNSKFPKISANGEYVREKDRAKQQGNGHTASPLTDDDVPF